MFRHAVLSPALLLTLFGCDAAPADAPSDATGGMGSSTGFAAGESSGELDVDPETGGESSSSTGDAPADCSDLQITEVSLFQVLETPLWDGAAISSADRAVPIVAGRQARVRVRMNDEAGASVVVHVADQAFEAELVAGSFHVDLPASAIGLQTSLWAEVDGCPQTATDPLPIDAVDTGPMAIHFVPFEVAGFVPDTSPAVIDGLRDAVFAVYPVTDVVVTVGDVVPDAYGGNLDMGNLLVDLGVIQEQQDQAPPNVYYYGLVTGAATRDAFCGDCPTGTSESGSGNRAAFAIGAAFADQRSEDTLIHELGHMHGLLHAPCGDPDLLDEDFPYEDASTTIEGWDVRTDTFIEPGAQDMMAYCYPRWISDYNYRRLVDWVQLAQTWGGR